MRTLVKPTIIDRAPSSEDPKFEALSRQVALLTKQLEATQNASRFLESSPITPSGSGLCRSTPSRPQPRRVQIEDTSPAPFADDSVDNDQEDMQEEESEDLNEPADSWKDQFPVKDKNHETFMDLLSAGYNNNTAVLTFLKLGVTQKTLADFYPALAQTGYFQERDMCLYSVDTTRLSRPNLRTNDSN